MDTKRISSDQARAKWREILDTAVSGHSVIIERYGKPVVAVIPYPDFVKAFPSLASVRERTAVYQTDNWNAMKAELIAEIKAELMSETKEADNWVVSLQQLRQRLKKGGEMMAGLTKEEIRARLRQTRHEIFEAEYAHLYR